MPRQKVGAKKVQIPRYHPCSAFAALSGANDAIAL